MPRGPTLRRLLRQLWREPLTSTCSVGVWDGRWRTTVQGQTLLPEKGPKGFSKLQLGDREEVASRDRLKPHTGHLPPVTGWSPT